MIGIVCLARLWEEANSKTRVFVVAMAIRGTAPTSKVTIEAALFVYFRRWRLNDYES